MQTSLFPPPKNNGMIHEFSDTDTDESILHLMEHLFVEQIILCSTKRKKASSSSLSSVFHKPAQGSNNKAPIIALLVDVASYAALRVYIQAKLT